MILYFPFYWARSRWIKREPLHFKERLGIGLPAKGKDGNSIWIHAVSVGEVLSLRKLVGEIKERHPEWFVYFSALTHSGFQMAHKEMTSVDQIFFVPLDFGPIVRKVFKKIQPDLFILAESEFWPNLLREARKQTKGVLLINGRISSRSSKRFAAFKYLMRKIFENIDFFLVQTERDKASLVNAGVKPDLIAVGGNLKAEIELPIFSDEALTDFKEKISISESKKVVVAGSTRKGEEEQLLSAFVRAKEQRTDIQLILAPRHVERAGEIAKLCEKMDVRAKRRTTVKPGDRWDILILDTLGELAQFYALSDVSFVGGSLVPWGGQNLLEPAFYSKPIFFGPHMDNFAHLARSFLEADSAKILREDEDIDKMFLFEDEQALDLLGKRANNTLQALSGATERALILIEKYMGTHSVRT
ncbi:MAG: 3-deoxy-D-manno-octulosonic acid transferase [Candidatus Aminicenantes bacterium]